MLLSLGGENLWPMEVRGDRAREPTQGGCCHHLGSRTSPTSIGYSSLYNYTPVCYSVNHSQLPGKPVNQYRLSFPPLLQFQLTFPHRTQCFNQLGTQRSLKGLCCGALEASGSLAASHLSLADTNLSTPAKSELSLRGKFTAYFRWNLRIPCIFHLRYVFDCPQPVFS